MSILGDTYLQSRKSIKNKHIIEKQTRIEYLKEIQGFMETIMQIEAQNIARVKVNLSFIIFK
jgi:hypothetical protein